MNEQAKSLADLGLTAQGGMNPMITGLTLDSRAVKPGMLFAALPGSQTHGARFIPDAVRLGAAAVLTDPAGAAQAHGIGVPMVIAEQVRAVFARTAALFFESQPRVVAAVTGTNGKTSVATFLRQIWQQLGRSAVNLGTTGVEGTWTAALAHTTPDPVTLHQALAEAARAGVTHAAMEASSHGLDQYRLDGVHLRAAGFTNLSQDHLDYHHTLQAYFEAKAQLFTRVLPLEATAVINIDDAYGVDLSAQARARGLPLLTVGRDRQAALRLTGQRLDATGQEVRFEYLGQAWLTRLDLIGGFQAENVALAAALAIACGEDPDQVMRALKELETVRGRMELAAQRANGAAIFVDYAHTPDAVATALSAMRPHVMGRLVAIVGAGGDRDRSKRPLMGRAAAQNADIVYITDDNPRSEEPSAIRAAVKEGCPGAIEIADRAEAILTAIDRLEPGDALLIAGKGHETGQIVGDDVLPFNDVEQASISVAALEGKL